MYILLLLLFSVTLEANYCIQVLTTNASDKNSIIREASNKYYNQFNDVRVESRGNYLVFRIGDYSQYNDARSDINAIRRFKKDAYVRKCDFIREQSIFIQNDRQDIQRTRVQERYTPQPVQQRYNPQPVQQRYVPQSNVQERYAPQAITKQKVPTKKYIKKEELTYEYINRDDSLWEDCKKCFVPVYKEEEDDTAYEPVKQKRVVQQRVPKKQEIEVRVQESAPTQESFWAEESVKPKERYIHKKTNTNKFNIDEQFLP